MVTKPSLNVAIVSYCVLLEEWSGFVLKLRLFCDWNLFFVFGFLNPATHTRVVKGFLRCYRALNWLSNFYSPPLGIRTGAGVGWRLFSCPHSHSQIGRVCFSASQHPTTPSYWGLLYSCGSWLWEVLECPCFSGENILHISYVRGCSLLKSCYVNIFLSSCGINLLGTSYQMNLYLLFFLMHFEICASRSFMMFERIWGCAVQIGYL